MTDKTVPLPEPDGLLPLSPHDHPEPQTMVWSRLEMQAIRRYAAACVAAERERCANVVRHWLAGYAPDSMGSYEARCLAHIQDGRPAPERA